VVGNENLGWSMPHLLEKVKNQHAALPAVPAVTAPVTAEQTAELVDLLLIVRVGDRRFAIPAAGIVRILAMAALIPVPDAPPGIAGALAFQGAVLLAVDPRPRLGLPDAAPRPDQILIVIEARTRYLLWVDRAEATVSASATSRTSLPGDTVDALAPQLVRVADEHLPVLSPEVLDPGPLGGSPDARRR
jgi:purine-binding chemotaxis protein CheW